MIKIVAFLIGCLLPAAIAAAVASSSSAVEPSDRTPRKPDPVAIYMPISQPAVTPPRQIARGSAAPARRVAAVASPARAARNDAPRCDSPTVVYRTTRTYVPYGYGGTYYGYPAHSWDWNLGFRYGGHGHHGRHYGHYGYRHGYHGGRRRHHGYVHGGYGHHYGSHWGVGVHFRF